jgi:hypothetical protein
MTIVWPSRAESESRNRSWSGRRWPVLAITALLGGAGVACEPIAVPQPAPSGSAAKAGPSSAPSPASATASATAATTGAVSAEQTAPEEIAAQHVLVAYRGAKRPPKTVTRSKAEAKKLAEEIAAQAKAREDFGALVAKYSDDASNKDRMGSLGKFKRDAMVKPFSDAAFALAVGETSGVVETEFGFHVIKRNQ